MQPVLHPNIPSAVNGKFTDKVRSGRFVGPAVVDKVLHEQASKEISNCWEFV